VDHFRADRAHERLNVGGRGGTPDAPSPTLDAGAFSRNVNPGQNIRLQIFNAATTRYFRLRLTTNRGALVQLFRIGGEGGLLNNPILEGGTTGSGFVTGYDAGEILLPPGSRAEVVAAIPTGLTVGTFLTMWTEDFAERICRRVTNEGLRKDCVFDVATTGDEIFEVAARLAQQLRNRGTAVQLVADKPRVNAGEAVTLTATVTTLFSDAKRPRGAVTFFVDDVQTGAPVRIDSLGRAIKTLHGLKAGEHRIRASFDAGTRMAASLACSPAVSGSTRPAAVRICF
jgi:hypothetical protein